MLQNSSVFLSSVYCIFNNKIIGIFSLDGCTVRNFCCTYYAVK